jgi:hypothetical protein
MTLNSFKRTRNLVIADSNKSSSCIMKQTRNLCGGREKERKRKKEKKHQKKRIRVRKRVRKRASKKHLLDWISRQTDQFNSI